MLGAHRRSQDLVHYVDKSNSRGGISERQGAEAEGASLVSFDIFHVKSKFNNLLNENDLGGSSQKAADPLRPRYSALSWVRRSVLGVAR